MAGWGGNATCPLCLITAACTYACKSASWQRVCSKSSNVSTRMLIQRQSASEETLKKGLQHVAWDGTESSCKQAA